MRNITLASLSIIAIMSLAGCGSTDDNDVVTTSVSGVAVDPELIEATVFVDANNDGLFSTGELSTTTDNNGSFTLNIPSQNLDKPLVVTGGLDKATMEPFTGKFSALLETDSTAQNLTPLTTLVHTYQVQNQLLTLTQTKAQVASSLGITEDDLDKNPVEVGNEALLKISMELERVASYINEKDSNVSTTDIYNDYAQALSNGTNFTDLVSTVIDDNNDSLDDLDKEKLNDLHLELGSIDVSNFSAYSLALTIDNIDKNISAVSDRSKLSDDLFNNQLMVIEASELEDEMNDRENKYQEMLLQQSSGDNFNLSDYPISELNDETKNTLAYMWNEERLAYDMYSALYLLYPQQNSFVNIATKSEVKHVELVRSLLERYDINITNISDANSTYSDDQVDAFEAGTYSVDAIQNLYDTLYTEGTSSVQDALEVGCQIEVLDVNDLDLKIQTAQANGSEDVVAVFEILRKGSYVHYWAYDKGLKAIGVTEGCGVLGAEYTKTLEQYPTQDSI